MASTSSVDGANDSCPSSMLPVLEVGADDQDTPPARGDAGGGGVQLMEDGVDAEAGLSCCCCCCCCCPPPASMSASSEVRSAVAVADEGIVVAVAAHEDGGGQERPRRCEGYISWSTHREALGKDFLAGRSQCQTTAKRITPTRRLPTPRRGVSSVTNMTRSININSH